MVLRNGNGLVVMETLKKFPAVFPHDPVASLKRFWISEKEIISDVLLQLI
ncbi:hypothetical protein [Acetobacter aceti]|nr:hypothetical protein [Acetobacter aceti]